MLILLPVCRNLLSFLRGSSAVRWRKNFKICERYYLSYLNRLASIPRNCVQVPQIYHILRMSFYEKQISLEFGYEQDWGLMPMGYLELCWEFSFELVSFESSLFSCLLGMVLPWMQSPSFGWQKLLVLTHIHCLSLMLHPLRERNISPCLSLHAQSLR